MNLISLVLREMIGMFIDDEFLAIAVLAIIALAAVCAYAFAALPLLAGAILIIGMIGVLAGSVLRAARPR